MTQKHVHIHPQRLTGSSAHTWDELMQDMNAGALKGGTFHLTNLKGSTAGIVAPEEFSGSNYDQTFLQGVDVKTYEQSTSYITSKIRPNSDYNIIRSNKIGDYASGLNPTSSFPYSQHRVLRLDEPSYFDDNTSPASIGLSGVSGSKAQLDTSSNRRKPFIHNKHYRERRDLGQHELFPGGVPYKDTTTVDPTLIVGAETGFEKNNIEFPPYMVHATDRISTDGTIEAYPIRSVADRSNLQHPHTARGIKSDLNLIDVYRKSDTMQLQAENLGNRDLIIGRRVRTFTSIICAVANATNGDFLRFTVGGVQCTLTVANSDSAVSTPSGQATVSFAKGSTDKELAQSLQAALVKIRAVGVKISVSRADTTVFLREVLDRQRTKGVLMDADDGGSTTSSITSVQTSGGFTIEFFRYSDMVYESQKTRALGGYDYYLDGVESFGIEILDNAERVKLLTSSIANPDSEDPDDRIRVDAYTPWLVFARSGTFGEEHIGPVNTQGYVAPEHASISYFEDDSDADVLGRKLNDDNTFAAKPNFFLTDQRVTLEGNTYKEDHDLIVQASWLSSATPFVTSSHAFYQGSNAVNDIPVRDGLSSKRVFASGSVEFTDTQPDIGSFITLTDSIGGSSTYTFGVNVDIQSSVTLSGEEYRNKILANSDVHVDVFMKGSTATIQHQVSGGIPVMPDDGSTLTITLPVAGKSVTKMYVYKSEGTTGTVEGGKVVVKRGTTHANAVAALKVALDGSTGHSTTGPVTTSVSGNTLTIAGLTYSKRLTATSFKDAVQKSQGNTILAQMATDQKVKIQQKIVEYGNLGNVGFPSVSVPNPKSYIDMTTSTPTDRGSLAQSLSYSGGPSITTEAVSGRTLKVMNFSDDGDLISFGANSNNDWASRYVLGDSASKKITIAAYVNRTHVGGTQATVVDVAALSLSLVLTPFGSGQFIMTLYAPWSKAGNQSWVSHTAHPMNDGQWTHVAVTYDMSSYANKPVFYIDGVAYDGLSAEVGLDSPGPSDTLEVKTVAEGTPNDAVIGNITQSQPGVALGTFQFRGKMSEVFVSDKILNNAEIISLKNRGPLATLLGANTNVSKIEGGEARALSGTGMSGSVSFVKQSPYYPESKHYGFTSRQGSHDTYPAVSVISGSHLLSGRKFHEEMRSAGSLPGGLHRITEVGDTNFKLIGASENTVGTYFTATGVGAGSGKTVQIRQANPKFSDDSPWTVSYWMSGSDERADHFRSVRDVMHFRDTSDPLNGTLDTADLYPNVPNFSVRHFTRRNYGFLYVSLYDNDFYPNNHHRVDFIFGGVKKGVTTSFLRNSAEENSLYNAIADGKNWNHFAISYDGGMHSTDTNVAPFSYAIPTGGSVVGIDAAAHGARYQIVTVGNTTNWQALGASSNTPSVGEIFQKQNVGASGSGHGTVLPVNTYENFLQSLENETRHTSDTVTHGPNIAVNSSATLVNGEQYIIMSVGNISTSDWQGLMTTSVTPAPGAVFTYNNSALGGISGSGTVRLRADKYLDAPVDNSSTRTLLYNYGVDRYEPFTITGSLGSGKVACPVRLYLNGIDITDSTLEYVTHNSVKTSGQSDRYGKDYLQSSAAASVTLTYTGNLSVGQTITLISADNHSKTYEICLSSGTPSAGNVKVVVSAADDGDGVFTDLRNQIVGASGHGSGRFSAVLDTTANELTITQVAHGSAGNTSITHTLANTSPGSPSAFTGGTDAGDYRDIKFSGEVYTLSAANANIADGTKAFSGHTVMSSSIVFGGDPNAVSFNRKIVKKTSTNDFSSSTSTHVGRRVHANQNTNTIAEFAMWGKELAGDQIKAVWELSRFNDILFTVQKPMAEALSRMNASFEDGVDKGHRHATKGFVFGNSEHGTDSIVYGGLKK